MSEGRIDNLAALMAAMFVVLKTCDLPQKMKPAKVSPKDPAPYGLYTYVGKQLGLTGEYVSGVMTGRYDRADVRAAVEAARATFVSPRNTTSKRSIINAVAQECGVLRANVEKVARGTDRAARIEDCLLRHGWPEPLQPKTYVSPFVTADRDLINLSEVARNLGCSRQAVTNVALGRHKSDRIYAAIADAVAAAKQKQARL